MASAILDSIFTTDGIFARIQSRWGGGNSIDIRDQGARGEKIREVIKWQKRSEFMELVGTNIRDHGNNQGADP